MTNEIKINLKDTVREKWEKIFLSLACATVSVITTNLIFPTQVMAQTTAWPVLRPVEIRTNCREIDCPKPDQIPNFPKPYNVLSNDSPVGTLICALVSTGEGKPSQNLAMQRTPEGWVRTDLPCTQNEFRFPRPKSL